MLQRRCNSHTDTSLLLGAVHKEQVFLFQYLTFRLFLFVNVCKNCHAHSRLLQRLAHKHRVFKTPSQVKRIKTFTRSSRNQYQFRNSVTNQKTPEAGQALQAFVYSSKLGW